MQILMQRSLRTKLVHTVANTVHHANIIITKYTCTVYWNVPIPSWLCGAPEHHTLRVSSPRQQPYAQNCHSDHSSGHGQDPISSMTMCVVCIMSVDYYKTLASVWFTLRVKGGFTLRVKVEQICSIHTARYLCIFPLWLSVSLIPRQLSSPPMWLGYFCLCYNKIQV